LVLRFAGPGKGDYLDAYHSSSPREFIYFSGSTLGQLEDGYVELNPEAWNVFDRYIGESSIGRWIVLGEEDERGKRVLEEEVFLVSSRGTEELRVFLEQLVGEEMEPVSYGELLEKGLEPAVEKEGH